MADADIEQVDETWARITELGARHDHTALALIISELDGPNRRAIVPRLRAYARPIGYREHRIKHDCLVSIVGAGVLPDAKSIAAILKRNQLWYANFDDGTSTAEDIVPHLHFVLRERTVPWLGDLAYALSAQLPVNPGWIDYERRPGLFGLVERLVDQAGIPAPASDGYIVAWVAAADSSSLVQRWSHRPDLAALVPRFFELDSVGNRFATDKAEWPAEIAHGARVGALDRATVLDACVARLRRGGKPGATRGYLDVHEALNPTADEFLARRDDYLAIAESAPSTVVGMVQRRLFALDDRGLADSASTLRYGACFLRRPEKKLVRAQLSRFAAQARTSNELASELALVVASAFATLTSDLARPAVAFVRDQCQCLGPDERGTIAELARSLPRDLAAELADGVSIGPIVPLASRDLSARPQWPGVRAVKPIEKLPDLAEALARALEPHRTADSAIRHEQVLEALVRFGRTQPEELRTELSPILASQTWSWMRPRDEDAPSSDEADDFDYFGTDYHVANGIAAVTAAVLGEPSITRDLPKFRASERRRLSVHLAVVDRVYQLADAVRHRPGALIVSLPSRSDGVIDSDVLFERLAAADRYGWRPWSFDLDVALLRLDATENDVARFAALGTEAGDRVAGWVRRKMPGAATVETDRLACSRHRWDGVVEHAGFIVVAEVRGGCRNTGSVWDQLVDLSYPIVQGDNVSQFWRTYPAAVALLPRHREVTAAHLIIEVADAAESAYDSEFIATLFVALAEADGDVGLATLLVFAYGLNAKAVAAREPVIDGLRILAARDQLPAADFGSVLALIIRRGGAITKRIAAGLRAAAEHVGDALIRDVVLASLASLVNDSRRTGLAEFLALGCDLVERTGAKGRVAGLDELAVGKGGSRTVLEAKRLQRLLAATD